MRGQVSSCRIAFMCTKMKVKVVKVPRNHNIIEAPVCIKETQIVDEGPIIKLPVGA